MRLDRIVSTIVSRAVGTPIRWSAGGSLNALYYVDEAREKWSNRPDSLRLRTLMERLSVLFFRKVASAQEPEVNNLVNVLNAPPYPDIPEYERQVTAYSAFMAVFKVDASSEGERFSLAQPSSLKSYLEVAGIGTSPLDKRTPLQALSRSRPKPGERPEFMFNPRSIKSGTLNHELSHELFHTASPLGGGLCLDGHAREILANRFAVEVSHPVPWMIRLAEADAARVLDSPFAFEEVMRISNRPMFAVTVPVDKGEQGSIVLQARGNLIQWGDPERTRLSQTWDELVLWSKLGKVDYFPPGVSWKPELLPADGHGFVNLQTIDGLYYVIPCTDDIWSSFTDSGIVDLTNLAGLAPGIARFHLQEVSEIASENHHIVLEGGQYLVIHVLRNVVSVPGYHSHRTYQLFGIKDEAGQLYQAWEQATDGWERGWGPLLPIMDPHRHEHLVPFDNWWLATKEWREVTFDFWAELVAGKFIRDLTAGETQERQRREEAKIEGLLSGRHDPGFIVGAGLT